MSTATACAAREPIGSARNAFANLEQRLYSHTSATHQLHTVEVEQERRGREVLRLMLQAHIDSRGNGWLGDGLAVHPAGSSGHPAMPICRVMGTNLTGAAASLADD